MLVNPAKIPELDETDKIIPDQLKCTLTLQHTKTVPDHYDGSKPGSHEIQVITRRIYCQWKSRAVGEDSIIAWFIVEKCLIFGQPGDSLQGLLKIIGKFASIWCRWHCLRTLVWLYEHVVRYETTWCLKIDVWDFCIEHGVMFSLPILNLLILFYSMVTYVYVTVSLLDVIYICCCNRKPQIELASCHHSIISLHCWLRLPKKHILP